MVRGSSCPCVRTVDEGCPAWPGPGVHTIARGCFVSLAGKPVPAAEGTVCLCAITACLAVMTTYERCYSGICFDSPRLYLTLKTDRSTTTRNFFPLRAAHYRSRQFKVRVTGGRPCQLLQGHPLSVLSLS